MGTPNVILIVDDDPMNIELVQQHLGGNGYEFATAEQGEVALRALDAFDRGHGFPGVVLTDMKMPVMDGLALLTQAHEKDPHLPIVLLTAYGDVQAAVQAMRSGAYDFIERPYDPERLQALVARALRNREIVLENRTLKAALARRDGIDARIIGVSPAIDELRRSIMNVADTDATVLIHGETGAGKELVARCLHEFGGRANANFVALNCGAIPETMLEAELFGHEAGAFTGASKKRIGRIEHADGGTLFLDEIEAMPLAHQVRLLRALQERSIERLGSNAQVPVEFRLVAASKVDLLEAVQAGSFREDLYYRLNVVALPIPPLRERGDDIRVLFERFAMELAERHRRPVPEVNADTLQTLLAYQWPGNVRELRNVAERHVLGLASTNSAVLDGAGNVQAVVDQLSIPRRTLYEKMRKHGLDRRDFN